MINHSLKLSYFQYLCYESLSHFLYKDTKHTLIFQPSGPNFFLSWMIAWKKQIPNTILLQSLPRTWSSKNPGVISVNALLVLALSEERKVCWSCCTTKIYENIEWKVFANWKYLMSAMKSYTEGFFWEFYNFMPVQFFSLSMTTNTIFY